MTNLILEARIHLLNLVFFFIDLCVLPLLPVHSSSNHFGSRIFSLGNYDLALFSLHLDSQYIKRLLN